VLDHPQDQQQWEKSGGLTGYVTAEIIKKHLFPPPEAGCKDEEQVVTFLCGPPAMIQKAALPALKGMSPPVALWLACFASHKRSLLHGDLLTDYFGHARLGLYGRRKLLRFLSGHRNECRQKTRPHHPRSAS
jgi:hypothetical protein